MANFFEKISKTGHETIQKVKETNEITKLIEMIDNEQKKRDFAYADLGRALLNAFDNGIAFECDSEPAVTLISTIRECTAKIDEFSNSILRIKNIKRCPACGRECSEDSVFCSGCGKQLPTQIVQMTDPHRCANCGAEINDDDLFCFNCGKKIER